MNPIGFIGLGIMGRPMAKNLLRKGREIMVYDIDPAAMQDMADHGARVAGSPREIGEACDIILTSLPDAPQVREVLYLPGGVLSGAKPGTIVIDTSSLSPFASREIEENCRACSVIMLDAPVSGGEPKAIDGTLAFMVGGREDAFEKIKDILLDMGASTILVGGHGAGAMAKLANQVIVNLTIAAMGEAMMLAVRGGVDPGKVYDAIRGGLAGSVVLDAKMPMVLARNFKPGGKISINKKDIRNVMETAATLQMDMPLTTVLSGIFNWLEMAGKAGLDHAAIVQYYEKVADMEIRSRQEEE
jgi:2-hydroxy-3-oxopropionate reductase